MKYLRPILCAALLAAACCVPDRRERTVRMPEPPAPERIRLLFGGDVMQHLPQIQAARSNGGFDYRDVFAALAPRFRAADLVVVNLETTLADAEPYAGYPVFRSPAALADALHEAGVDVAVLANNHCCDGGLQGIRTTVRELKRCGIRHTGVFRDSADYRRNHPLLLRRGGISIALLNYTYGTNGLPVPAGTLVNRIDTAAMARDLAAARHTGADCIAGCIHWGNEYERRPIDSQRMLARFLRRHGADLVIGSHPHVVQPYEADTATAVI